MQQIVNLTTARSNLSSLVKKVARTQSQVVIVRDSMPEAVLVPYSAIQKTEDQWRKRWARIISQTRAAGKKWAKKRGVRIDKLTEQEMYDLVKKA